MNTCVLPWTLSSLNPLASIIFLTSLKGMAFVMVPSCGERMHSLPSLTKTDNQGHNQQPNPTDSAYRLLISFLPHITAFSPPASIITPPFSSSITDTWKYNARYTYSASKKGDIISFFETVATLLGTDWTTPVSRGSAGTKPRSGVVYGPG